MGESGGMNSSCNLPRGVEEVFEDYDCRRTGILNALIHQAEYFFQQCRPDSGRQLCLYAFPDRSWKLLSSEELEETGESPPRPMLGINIPRDNMYQEDWLTLVAIHSDSWLLGVAVYLAALNGFNQNDTKRLLQMINGVPTVAEAFTLANRTKLTSAQDRHSSIPNSEASVPVVVGISRTEVRQDEDSGDEYEAEDGDETVSCLVCEEKNESELWICCDVCDRWCHGECVNITERMVRLELKEFICPFCATKRRRTN